MIRCQAQPKVFHRCPEPATCALLDDDDQLRLVCPAHWGKPATAFRYRGRAPDPATWSDELRERAVRALLYRLLLRTTEAGATFEVRQGKTRRPLPAEDLALRTQRIESLARSLAGLVEKMRGTPCDGTRATVSRAIRRAPERDQRQGDLPRP